MSGTKPILAMVTDSIQPYFLGGKEARYFELSRRLVADFDVHVYTMKWWTGPRTHRRDGITFHGICPRVPMYKAGGRRSIRQALLFALGCLGLLTARFDVLEADHMPYLHLVVLRLVSWVRRRRMVVTWHEVWGPAYWRTYLGRAGLVAHFIEKISMRLPDAIIAASDETAARLRQALGERASVYAVPNGVDVAAIEAIDPALRGVDLVTVGRLIRHKRVDLILEAVARLKHTHGNVTCRIIGSGPEHERILGMIRELGLEDNVEVLSDVSDNSELFGLVKASRVFVLASEREGFGIAALEGLACGLPVVTTSTRDNLAQHLVSSAPGGVVCDPGPESLVDWIGAVLDKKVAPADATELRDWLIPYTWAALTQQVSAVLQDSCRRTR